MRKLLILFIPILFISCAGEKIGDDEDIINYNEFIEGEWYLLPEIKIMIDDKWILRGINVYYNTSNEGDRLDFVMNPEFSSLKVFRSFNYNIEYPNLILKQILYDNSHGDTTYYVIKELSESTLTIYPQENDDMVLTFKRL